MNEEKSTIAKTAYRWMVRNDHLPPWIFTSIKRPIVQKGKTSGESFFTLIEPVICDDNNFDLPQVLLNLCLSNVREAQKALGEFKLQCLDEQGNIMDEWIYRDAYISFVDFGSFDYKSEGAVQITCILTHKKVEYVPYYRHKTI